MTPKEKIWIQKERYKIHASVTYSVQFDCLDSDKLSTIQLIKIKEQLKEDMYAQIFGHMPRSLLTVEKHLKEAEKLLRELGHEKAANKLIAANSLIDVVLEQMTPHGRKIAHLSPTERPQIEISL